MRALFQKIAYIPLIFFLFTCKNKDSDFEDNKNSQDIILWKENLNIKAEDFLLIEKSNKTIYDIEIATRTTENTNVFKYYVFFNKKNSFLNKNQNKQKIQNDILMATISMNIFEIEARKLKKKFQNENIVIKKRLQAKYLVSDFGRNVDNIIEKYKKVLEDNNYNKETVSKMKEGFKLQLKSL